MPLQRLSIKAACRLAKGAVGVRVERSGRRQVRVSTNGFSFEGDVLNANETFSIRRQKKMARVITALVLLGVDEAWARNRGERAAETDEPWISAVAAMFERWRLTQ